MNKLLGLAVVFVGCVDRTEVAAPAPLISGPIGALVATADAVEVCVTEWSGGDIRDNCETFPGKDQVKRFAEMVDTRESPGYKCGFHLTAYFKRGSEVVTRINVNVDHGCTHASTSAGWYRLTGEGEGWFAVRRLKFTEGRLRDEPAE